jgi:GNAT superfamily N-acetyltransferase
MATARTVRRDELEDLLELYRMLNPDDPELDPEDVDHQWVEMVADDSLDVVVVEHDDRLVASCVLSVTPNLTRGARPFALIENVVTHEEYRGQGFGSRVLEEAIEIAEERDCYKVMLLTGTEQEWKLQFYEDCGFGRDRKTAFEMDLRDF